MISDERIAQTLALMSQPKGARVTQELGRGVCQRTASAATIEGSISSLGSQYVLGLNAVNCRTGDLLAQEQEAADGKEHVLKALGDAATKLRGKLGESLASVEKYDVPLPSVTTSSLEALQAYSLGGRAIGETDFAAAISFFQRAVNLDPNFAMAFQLMGVNYANLNENARAAESIRKAYELRGRTSEREKLFISASYQDSVTGNLEAARSAYELLAQTYPRAAAPQTYLSDIYARLGEYEKGLRAAQEALRLDPGSGVNYGNLVGAYVVLNRPDEAIATAQEARSHKLDGPYLRQVLYQVDFLEHDAAGMAHDAGQLMGKQGWEDVMLDLESDTAAYAGEFAKAREQTRRAADSAQRADEKETAAGYKAEASVREALVGNMAVAKQEAQAALALANGRDPEGISAIAVGLTGDSAQAARLAGDLGKRFPEDTIAQSQYLPMIHSVIALQRGDADKAVEALAAAEPYELGQGTNPLSFYLYPAYLRGEAYVAAKQGTAAAIEFQKILDHPGVVVNDPIGALAHLGLGRAYALSGDSAKAKTSYQHFFALWKNADPDIPLLRQAKAEYAKLR
jgi:eukaryotic-like serine/threonine-protein kinase